MASVKDFIEAGNEYMRRIAANNPIITIKKASIWFQEIADKLEHDVAVSEMVVEYNLWLIEGEEPMTEAEMEEILGEKGGIDGTERRCVDCMVLKDHEIACLKQRIGTLENMLKNVHDHGISWKDLREARGE